MKAEYPAGSYVPSKSDPKGGFSFYGTGPKGTFNIAKAEEITFGYSIYFPADFDWVKGGKLPGICTFLIIWIGARIIELIGIFLQMAVEA